jgi:hypothetical protein
MGAGNGSPTSASGPQADFARAQRYIAKVPLPGHAAPDHIPAAPAFAPELAKFGGFNLPKSPLL